MGLSASDYNYFYPQSQYTGFNVMQASVVKKDIEAENGIINEINKVITPPLSIDQYLKTQTKYSHFKDLLNRFVQFIPNENATERYNILTGKANVVYIKTYSPLLSYSPNNENFLKAEANDGQMNCWTMFVPKNQALDSFVNNVLLKYYHTIDSLPTQILADFLNAHMFPTVVWPSKFNTTTNSFGEPAHFDPYSDVLDHKILSNGIVYGTDKVEVPDEFSTVYGEAYLNPNFTMMIRLFNLTGLNLLIARASVPVDIFLIPDKVFYAAGFHYNEAKSQFEYTSSAGTTTNNVVNELTRIIQTCVFFDPYREELNDLSGSGIVKSGDAGTESEYIKYNNNTIITAGLQDEGKVAHLDSTKIAKNGKVYYLDQLPIFTDHTVGYDIMQLGEDSSSAYYDFWEYLSHSSLFSSSTNIIAGLTGFNTVFAPSNEAILKAVNDGLLPGTGNAPNKVPNFNPKSPQDQNLVREFIQYHILKGHTVVPDGQISGSFDTYLQDQEGNTVSITINNHPNELTIIDSYGRKANIVVSESNNLSNRCVIHLIDNYLKYKLN